MNVKQCDSSIIVSGPTFIVPYKSLTWNTITHPTLTELIPQAGFTTSDPNCPIESFSITTDSGASVYTGGKCPTIDLSQDCRTINLSKAGVTKNGPVDFTFKITAKAKGNLGGTLFGKLEKDIKIKVDFDLCDINGHTLSYTGISLNPYLKTQYLNTLSSPRSSIIIPSAGFTTSDPVNCPLTSFKIEEIKKKVSKSPTKTCPVPDLLDPCRTLNLDVSKITSNGEI